MPLPHDLTGQRIAITGASSGLGKGFAKALAHLGADVWLLARRRDRLDALATKLRTRGARATVVPVDLSDPAKTATAADQMLGERMTGLVNAAGFGTFGPLSAADPDRIDAEGGVNVAALTTLTTRLWPSILAADSGLLLNIASTAAFQPLPEMAVYGAAKAYVRSLTVALADEAAAAGSPATVLCLCPGPTRTEFFDVIATDQFALTKTMTVKQVVGRTLTALTRPHPPVVLIPGAANHALASAARLMPDRPLAHWSGLIMRSERSRRNDGYRPSPRLTPVTYSDRRTRL